MKKQTAFTQMATILMTIMTSLATESVAITNKGIIFIIIGILSLAFVTYLLAFWPLRKTKAGIWFQDLVEKEGHMTPFIILGNSCIATLCLELYLSGIMDKPDAITIAILAVALITVNVVYFRQLKALRRQAAEETDGSINDHLDEKEVRLRG